jgi:hypothetical protein
VVAVAWAYWTSQEALGGSPGGARFGTLSGLDDHDRIYCQVGDRALLQRIEPVVGVVCQRAVDSLADRFHSDRDRQARSRRLCSRVR